MAAATKEPKKVKKGFKMPHLFWIMICLLFVSSLLTYVIPAGQFMTDPETGKILGDQFQYLGAQTPVSPLQVLLLLIDGLVNSSLIGWTVMVSGATVAIVMGTGAFDEFMNWAIYKLKDKDDSILIGVMFCLMVYLGAFGGSDALIAIVPIGVMFAKKLKLDPICAMGVSTYATLIGFGTGPTKQATTQMLMGVQIYGTFFTMFISMNIFMLAGLFFLLRYVKKIRKDPTLSPMWSEGWRPDEAGDVAAEEAAMLKEVKLSGRTILILIIYLMQYVVMVGYPMVTGDTSLTFKLMVAMGLITSISCGFIGGFSFDKIGNEFGKGLASMAFVAFVIGHCKLHEPDPHPGQYPAHHRSLPHRSSDGPASLGSKRWYDCCYLGSQPADPLGFVQGSDSGADPGSPFPRLWASCPNWLYRPSSTATASPT